MPALWKLPAFDAAIPGYDMYRRIELINDFSAEQMEMLIAFLKTQGGMPEIASRDIRSISFKHRITGPTSTDISAAVGDLPVPKKAISKNGRYYFTEVGWDRYGRAIVTLRQQLEQRYRIIATKEMSVEVFCRDEFQVMVRPLRKRKETVSRETSRARLRRNNQSLRWGQA